MADQIAGLAEAQLDQSGQPVFHRHASRSIFVVGYPQPQGKPRGAQVCDPDRTAPIINILDSVVTKNAGRPDNGPGAPIFLGYLPYSKKEAVMANERQQEILKQEKIRALRGLIFALNDGGIPDTPRHLPEFGTNY